MNLLVSLIGEQPVPNLLPIRYWKPSRVAFIYSGRTREVARRLEVMLRQGDIEVSRCEVNAYDLPGTYRAIKDKLRETGEADVAVNLTGGTKIMSLAAYQVAFEDGFPFLYLQSEGQINYLYTYHFEDGSISKQVEIITLPPLLTIDDYLRVHVGNYCTWESSDPFEAAVSEALAGRLDEVVQGVRIGDVLEIDLVLRHGNQVGVAEVKSGRRAQTKDGIDQLSTATAREYLGTYTAKFLIVDRSWEVQTELQALAKERNIHLVHLPSYSPETGTISDEDKQRCVEQVVSILSGGQSTR